MKKNTKILSFTFLSLILIAITLLTLQFFLIEPSGIYSSTVKPLNGFSIGANKNDLLKSLGNRNFVLIQSKDPSTAYTQGTQEKWVLKNKLLESNYWILHESNKSHVLLFENDRVIRVISHFRRFGDLESHSPLFINQMNSTNKLEGLSEIEIDNILLEQGIRVFFVSQSNGTSK